MSAAAVLLLVLVLAALAGAGVAAFFATASYRRSQMLGGPSVEIADLPPGFGKVRGAVAARGKLLSGPLSGRPCVYYRFRVEEERRKVYRKARPGEDAVTTNVFGAAHGRVIDGWTNERSTWVWAPVVDERRGARAVVRDRTGEAEVDLGEAEVAGGDEVRLEADEQRVPSKALEEMLKKKYRFWVVDEEGRPKKLRIVEEVLEEGAKVTVAGDVRVEVDDAAAFDEGALVSDRGLKAMAKGHRVRALALAGVAGGLLVVALILLVATILVA